MDGALYLREIWEAPDSTIGFFGSLVEIAEENPFLGRVSTCWYLTGIFHRRCRETYPEHTQRAHDASSTSRQTSHQWQAEILSNDTQSMSRQTLAQPGSVTLYPDQSGRYENNLLRTPSQLCIVARSIKLDLASTYTYTYFCKLVVNS